MKFTKFLSLALLLSPLDTLANEPSKYRMECALTSKEFKDNLPSGFTSVWCADDKRKDFGEMGPDVVHAIVVAAFYEKRMDRRLAAMNLLERYDCKDKKQCNEFHYLLDWGIKSGHPARYSRELADRAATVRERVTLKLKSL